MKDGFVSWGSVAVVFVSVTFLVWQVYLLRQRIDQLETKGPPPSITIEPSSPASSQIPPSASAFSVALDNRDQAINRCASKGDVAVMGFGLVVCVNEKAVVSVTDPGFPR